MADGTAPSTALKAGPESMKIAGLLSIRTQCQCRAKHADLQSALAGSMRAVRLCTPARAAHPPPWRGPDSLAAPSTLKDARLDAPLPSLSAPIAAAAAAADREGTVLDAPALADAICHDPLLGRLKLVALASDDTLLPRQGQSSQEASGRGPLTACCCAGNPGPALQRCRAVLEQLGQCSRSTAGAALQQRSLTVCLAAAAAQQRPFWGAQHLALHWQAGQADSSLLQLTSRILGPPNAPTLRCCRCLPHAPAAGVACAVSRTGASGSSATPPLVRTWWPSWQRVRLACTPRCGPGQLDLPGLCPTGGPGRCAAGCWDWGLRLRRRHGAQLMHRLLGDPSPPLAGTPGLLTTMAGRLTGSASIFDADWDAGLPGNLAIGARGRSTYAGQQGCSARQQQPGRTVGARTPHLVTCACPSPLDFGRPATSLCNEQHHRAWPAVAG